MTSDGLALGKEDSLNLAFANKLVESPEFVSWLLARTKFKRFAHSARLLHEEQARARAARFWWRHWWCNIPELSGHSETDIYLAFEVEHPKDRFSLHIENKMASSKFMPNQERSYAIRAKYMLDHSTSAQFRCTDFDTVLIAPICFREGHREQCDHFGQFIPYDEIATFVPEFSNVAGAISKQTAVRKVGRARPQALPIQSLTTQVNESGNELSPFACPSCSSENTQKASVLHAAGTSAFASQSLSTGVGWASGGGARVSTTSGRQKTALAQQHAPPTERSISKPHPFGCLFVTVSFSFATATIFASPVAGLLVLVLGVAVSVTQFRKTLAPVLPFAKARWAEQFVCLRCGYKFLPGKRDGDGKTLYRVILTSFGANKISVIAAVRSMMGIGLKEAKDFVEAAPIVVIEDVSKEQAELLKEQLEATGASVEVH